VEQPSFYYDLSSPEAYLAAERCAEALGVGPEWRPVHMPLGEPGDRAAYAVRIEQVAAQRGLQPVRWPARWPFDSELAMLVATYARQIGRAVAFSLAAFRQAYAGGRDLSTPEGVVIAAAACEMHPNAVLRSAVTRGVRGELERATAAAREAGVERVPAVRVGDAVFHGDEGLEAAADALAGVA
jgi:2-hydroxychromene-2-carboxylate isomerase